MYDLYKFFKNRSRFADRTIPHYLPLIPTFSPKLVSLYDQGEF